MSTALIGCVKRRLSLAVVVTSAVVASCVALISSALPLHSATLGRLSMDDLITQSTSIVRGKVTASWAAATGSVICTHYQIQVIERLKGAPQNTVEVMVPGGTVNGRQYSPSGSPVLNQGDEFVFFLWTSSRGVTWITGLTQGLFALPADGATDRMASRAASRELMLDPVTARPVKDVALAMRLSDLRSLVSTTQAPHREGK
jgi:hypothetical protein